MTDRNGLLDKIRALMSKTVDNGCTEAEAMAALDKARAMMDAYEVTETDLQLSKEEVAVLRNDPMGKKDPNGIRRGLASGVARFCECKVWHGQDGLTFCGLPSDVEFAYWLLDSLTGFVQGELVNHLIGSLLDRKERKLAITGFVMGCTRRITERVTALCNQSAAVANSNGRALVAVKGTAISDVMRENGIHLRSTRRSSRQINRDSFNAGKSAGERASFGRPVSGAAASLRLS